MIALIIVPFSKFTIVYLHSVIIVVRVAGPSPPDELREAVHLASQEIALPCVALSLEHWGQHAACNEAAVVGSGIALFP